MEEKAAGKAGDNYAATLARLNRYFSQTCDLTKERIKFRELRMESAEPFVDWVLRLEKQANFCEFEEEQRKGEFLQAVLTRSVPDISEKLYEMSGLLNNDLDQILAHGKHLDYIRSEKEGELKQKANSSNGALEQPPGEGAVVKPVYALQDQKQRYDPIRRGQFQGPRFGGKGPNSKPQPPRRYEKPVLNTCYKCGLDHGLYECKAWRIMAYLQSLSLEHLSKVVT